jgi:hypothetical protein
MTNAAYYAQRERAERTLAESTDNPRVRAIHLELAERYAKLRQRRYTAHAA